MINRIKKRIDMIKYVIAAFVLLFAITGSTTVKGSEERDTDKPAASVMTHRDVESAGEYSHREKSTTTRFCQLRFMPLQLIR